VFVFERSEPRSARVMTAVAVGGAIGAAGRWAVDVAGSGRLWAEDADATPGWPWATFTVNVIGALLIGAAARRIDRATLAWAFVVTGILGGFTTFSALAVELNELADADRMSLAAAYAVATMVVGIGASWLSDRTVPDP
jgi:CrcB protein